MITASYMVSARGAGLRPEFFTRTAFGEVLDFGVQALDAPENIATGGHYQLQYQSEESTYYHALPGSVVRDGYRAW